MTVANLAARRRRSLPAPVSTCASDWDAFLRWRHRQRFERLLAPPPPPPVIW